MPASKRACEAWLFFISDCQHGILYAGCQKHWINNCYHSFLEARRRERMAAGDDCGKIWVYDVGEQLAVPQPDEWNKFAHTLQVTQRSATQCIMNSLGQPIWGFCPILSSILYINWRFQNAVNTSWCDADGHISGSEEISHWLLWVTL